MAVGVWGGGCAGMLQVFSGLTPPRVHLRGVGIAERPSVQQLEASLCPRVLHEGPARVASTDSTCARLLGPAPLVSPSLTFDLDLVIENQNYVPMPVSEILVGINLFPDENVASWPGVSCMALCPQDNPFCWNDEAERPAQHPCEGARRGVPSERDYTGAHPDLIFARGVLLARGDRPRLEQPVLPPRSKTAVTARFSFVPGALVEVLTSSTRDTGAALRRGQPLPLVLPYEIDGAVYVSAGSGQRVGQAFGPVRGTWSLSGTVAWDGRP
jgi:hypothetical protein